MAQYFSGGPLVLISASFVPAGAPDLRVETIFADVGADDVRFFFRDDAQAHDFAESPLPPSNLLAIVATLADSAALQALWAERGLELPPLIVVETLAEAIGPVLACARAEIATVTARCAELQQALVETRTEFEETRSAMHNVMRTLSHRYATKMNLVAAVAPVPQKMATVVASKALQRVYPVGSEGVTCLALHINALQLGAKAFLRVVLFGAESGRVLGEWRRPGDALFDGWNTFDLPLPVAAVRETCAVETSLDDPEGMVAFSLGGGTGEEAPLAIRIWTADAAGRFPHARHWIWDAQGAMRPALGTAAVVDEDTIARIERHGRVEIASGPVDGAAASYLIRGGSSALCLRGLSIEDAEGIFVELARGIGDLGGTRFELAVQAAGRGLSSGWRWFDAASETLVLGVSLPATLPDTVDLALRIEDGKRPAHEFATVALRHIAIIAGKRGGPGVGLDEVTDPDRTPLTDADKRAVHFTAIKAANYNETEKYALFEVTLEGLAFDDRIQNGVKFKTSLSKGRISLEFRQGQKWPRIFQQWPGREQDRFGDVFRVAPASDGLAISGSLESDTDKKMLATLCRLMPVILMAGAQALPAAKARLPEWLEAARVFADAAERTFGGSGA